MLNGIIIEHGCFSSRHKSIWTWTWIWTAPKRSEIYSLPPQHPPFCFLSGAWLSSCQQQRRFSSWFSLTDLLNKFKVSIILPWLKNSCLGVTLIWTVYRGFYMIVNFDHLVENRLNCAGHGSNWSSEKIKWLPSRLFMHGRFVGWIWKIFWLYGTLVLQHQLSDRGNDHEIRFRHWRYWIRVPLNIAIRFTDALIAHTALVNTGPDLGSMTNTAHVVIAFSCQFYNSCGPCGHATEIYRAVTCTSCSPGSHPRCKY